MTKTAEGSRKQVKFKAKSELPWWGLPCLLCTKAVKP